MKIPLSNGLFSRGFLAGWAEAESAASCEKATTRPEKNNNMLRKTFLIVIVNVLFMLVLNCLTHLG